MNATTRTTTVREVAWESVRLAFRRYNEAVLGRDDAAMARAKEELRAACAEYNALTGRVTATEAA